jgi:hypothetical protein
MMKSHFFRWIPKASLLALLGVPFLKPISVLAGANLPYRTAQISAMEAHILQVESFTHIRISGENSLTEQIRRWNNDAKAFLSNLQAASRGTLPLDDAGFSQFKTDSANQKALLNRKRERLRLESIRLRAELKRWQLHLESLEVPKKDGLLYEQAQDASQKMATAHLDWLRLKQTHLELLGKKLSDAWEPAWQFYQLRVEQWLSSANVPEWKKKAEEFRAWIQAISQVQDILAPAEIEAERVKDVVSQFRPFAAKSAAEKLSSVCQNQVTLLSNAIVPDGVRTLWLEELRATCSEARNRSQSIWGTQPILAEWVSQFASRKASLARVECQNARPTYDCATARWLAQIPKKKIQQMSLGELELYESTWEKSVPTTQKKR